MPLDLGGWRLVTVESGAAHSHAGSGYNERRAECRAACEALGVEHVSAADPDAAAALPAPLDRRARHVLSENARVDATVAALRAGDLEEVAGCSTRPTPACATTTRPPCPRSSAPWPRSWSAGAAGARMVGGGFGGSVLALLPPARAVPDGAVAVAPGPPARLL